MQQLWGVTREKRCARMLLKSYCWEGFGGANEGLPVTLSAQGKAWQHVQAHSPAHGLLLASPLQGGHGLLGVTLGAFGGSRESRREYSSPEPTTLVA